MSTHRLTDGALAYAVLVLSDAEWRESLYAPPSIAPPAERIGKVTARVRQSTPSSLARVPLVVMNTRDMMCARVWAELPKVLCMAILQFHKPTHGRGTAGRTAFVWTQRELEPILSADFWASIETLDWRAAVEEPLHAGTVAR